MTSLTDLLKNLEVQAQSEEHEEVYESSYEILKSSPHDGRALRFTIVSLINLEKYAQALKIFKQFKGVDQDDLVLEKAYVYYKLSLEKELMGIFDGFNEQLLAKNAGLLHLKAQTLYRAGDYQAALKLYQQLISNASDEEIADLSVNERAVLSDAYQAGVLSKLNADASPVTEFNESSYDLIFNESLIYLGLKDYNKSLELLERAQELSENVNSTEEDRLSETIPIIIQKAYIYQITNDTEKSSEILDELKSLSLPDELTQLILNNNTIAFGNPSSPRLISRELNLPGSIVKLSSRLSQIQQAVLFRNYAKLSLQIGKSVTKPKSTLSSDLTIAALSSLQSKSQVEFDQQDVKTQAKLSFRTASKTKDVALSLLSAQLNVNAGNYDAAVAVLENLETQDKLIPAVATTLLSLYEHNGSQGKKLQLFELINEAYVDHIEFTESEFELLKIFALKFSTSAAEQSQAILHKLQHFNSQDEIINFVLSDSTQESTSLTSIDDLTSNIDLSALQTSAINAITSETVKPTAFKVTKRRTRNTKFAFDASKPLDEERWLPMKDRSYYKPKKSKKKGVVRDTQGGAADNTTEVSSVSGSARASPAPVPAASKNKKKKSKK